MRKKYFDEILRELSYVVPDGIPDLNNSAHLLKLQKLLSENGWNKNSIVKLMTSLKGIESVSVTKKEHKENIKEHKENIKEHKENIKEHKEDDEAVESKLEEESGDKGEA